MGKTKNPKPVKIISSLISQKDEWIEMGIEILMEKLGELDFKSQLLPFDFTDYYYKEMGYPLMRKIVAFLPLFSREELVEIKLWTNEVEELLSQNGKRRVNIDPGYISQHNLILATTKEAPHRPYLSKGIFADLTLIYEYGEFRPLKWTYPDYASSTLRGIFKEIRMRYLKQLKEWKC